MYGFQNVYKELNIKHVLELVPESILWRHYLGTDFKLKEPFSAPYRKDKNPSFSISYDWRGRLMYKDYGRSGVYGDIFNYLQLTLGLSFQDSLQKVNTDFSLGLGKPHEGQFGRALKAQDIKELYRFEKIFAKKNPLHYVCDTRVYTDDDYSYWMQYGIIPEILKKYHVYCLNKLFQNGHLVYSHTVQNPGYVYYFPKSKHIKAYFPKSDQMRFRGNVNNFEDIQGYYQCRVKEQYPNKTLILTKSMKDCMVLHSFGIDAMAIHGEGHFFHKDFIRHVKKYYPRVISLYDADRTGIVGARYLWKDYNIEPYFLPRWARSEQCKDISDMFKEYNEEEVRRFLEDELGLVTLEF